MTNKIRFIYFDDVLIFHYTVVNLNGGDATGHLVRTPWFHQYVEGGHMNLPQQILKRASEKGLIASCIQAPCGKRFWSFHLNANDIIYCSRFKITRPREAVINHIPEARALWFLDAYDQKLYDNLLYTGDTKPGVQKKI